MRSITKMIASIAVLAVALSAAMPVGTANAAPSQLTVDLSANTGALRYGATGFLYGLGDEGIPNETMLTALRPQVAAQKAPDGLQHPNGDALKVAPMFKRAGGRQIEIYMQDIYPSWPYDNLGLNDYLGKVDTIARKIVADPNRSLFVYVPFNEPDWIWYSGQITGRFLTDWRTVVQRIRAIDPGARIAGPGFTHYLPNEMRAFMTAARNNNVLPDVTTWHELGNDFFADWNNHYNNYRQIERDLGISARPITIDEYGRQNGDLGVPGNLVQYVAKFEASKVDACLAYWTTAGGLNDLVTRNNQATGGWWLYKWYGELTGNTVAVTPPSVGGALQGLAALDSGKQQARVIFGGNNPVSGTYDTNVVVRGLASAPYLGNTVHATVWGVDSTGQNPSSGPFLVAEGDYTASGGQVTVPLTGLRGSAAYHVILTPNKDLSAAGGASRYQAEYARLEGGARVTYGNNTGYSGTHFVEGYGASATASTKFVVTVPSDGYYNVGLRYSAGPYSGAPANRSLRLRLNTTDLPDLALPGTADWNTWNTVTTKVFLPAGISQLEANAYAGDDRDAVNLDYLDVTSTSGTITSYEAEASGNTLAGAAARGSNSGASGGQHVGFVGAGAGNTLRFNNVNVPTAGRYRMVVGYANAEVVGDHQYNNNIVDRGADISVNGGTARRTYFRNTLSWTTFRTAVVDVNLAAGANTITFGNASSGYAPDLDLIRIAAPIG